MGAFNDFKSKLLSFYQSKTESEQRLISLLALCFILFVLVSTVSSVMSGLADVESKLKKQQELNLWAKQQIAIIKQAGGGASSNSASGSMTQLINSTARQNGITLARLQPQTADAVKVGLEDINFNALMTWLAQLQNKHGIKVSNIDISKSDKQGVVRVRRLDLERK